MRREQGSAPKSPQHRQRSGRKEVLVGEGPQGLAQEEASSFLSGLVFYKIDLLTMIHIT
jgi:hypothetical protein